MAFRPRLSPARIVILPSLDNAYAGYGFMEIGAHPAADGMLTAVALNFDVMAHGSAISSSIRPSACRRPPAPAGRILRLPGIGRRHDGAHRGAAFRVADDVLLEETHGNLYVFNELDRFAELSPHDEIRLASNDVKLSQFTAGWDDEHALSQPLTGAIFDVAVDIFQELLVERD